jgi:hypothetical protein
MAPMFSRRSSAEAAVTGILIATPISESDTLPAADRYRVRIRPSAEDVNAWMVSQGWAIAYRRFSMDYVDEENNAHAKRKGAWRGHFVPAWEWTVECATRHPRRAIAGVSSVFPATGRTEQTGENHVEKGETEHSTEASS